MTQYWVCWSVIAHLQPPQGSLFNQWPFAVSLIRWSSSITVRPQMALDSGLHFMYGAIEQVNWTRNAHNTKTLISFVRYNFVEMRSCTRLVHRDHHRTEMQIESMWLSMWMENTIFSIPMATAWWSSSIGMGMGRADGGDHRDQRSRALVRSSRLNVFSAQLYMARSILAERSRYILFVLLD